MRPLGDNAVVLGLGRSGLGAARALIRHKLSVTISDRRPASEMPAQAAEAEAMGAGLMLGGHPEVLLTGRPLVVLSPGVPGDIPLLKAARAKGLEIIGEIELAYRLSVRHWLGVTGTNGKTTTTSLLAAMFQAAGLPYVLGGNIGKSLADEVEDADPSAVVVAELSSFQLEETVDFRPDVAVITNLTPDHLDRYPSMAAYAAAKARIFANQRPQDFLVLNAADQALLDMGKAAASARLLFSREHAVELGAWIEDGEIRLRLRPGAASRLMPLEELRLRGPHNQENALAAAAAAYAAGVPLEGVASALRSFAGVEHRLEFCGELDGVRFVNDSKATNVDSVEKALQSFNEPVHLILGGRDKQGDFGRLAPLVRDKVAEIFLIGEAADTVAGQLEGIVPMRKVKDLAEAARLGLENAGQGDWVLLSPGCASFDMFQNYEHRGRVFKEAVAALVSQRSKP